MIPRKHCHAVIPCLNEASTIGDLVAAVLTSVGGALVIDDGSSDHTAAAALSAGAEVIRHPHPRGKGACLRTGWNLLADRGLPWACCLDGDGQHQPSDIPRFLEAAERTSADLVVGNRFHAPAGMPWLRRVTNRVLSRWLSRRAGQEFPDSQCGFRLLRMARWQELDLQTAHFEIESELLLAAAQASWRIEFIPIQTVYDGEHSKIRPLPDTWRWLRWCWRSHRHIQTTTGSDPLRSATNTIRQPN